MIVAFYLGLLSLTTFFLGLFSILVNLMCWWWRPCIKWTF
jgi:hypothetical protein